MHKNATKYQISVALYAYAIYYMHRFHPDDKLFSKNFQKKFITAGPRNTKPKRWEIASVGATSLTILMYASSDNR